MPNETTLKPFRILIRGANWLGDSVISAAAVRAIKGGRPDAHLTVATPAKLAPMWKLIAEVDEVLSLPEKSLLAVVRLLKRQTPFDVAILFRHCRRTHSAQIITSQNRSDSRVCYESYEFPVPASLEYIGSRPAVGSRLAGP